MLPQAGVLEHMAVGIDGAVVLQAMDATRIEHGPHQRLLPGDQAVEHDAMPLAVDQPAVADEPALQSKSQPLGERRRRLVLGPDQRLDPVHLERVDQVAQQARPASVM